MDILTEEILKVVRELGVDAQRGNGREGEADELIVTIPVRTGTMDAVVDA